MNRCARIQCEPWGEYPHPDFNILFVTERGGLLLFHTTSLNNAKSIMAFGFRDNVCKIGFTQRPSHNAVYLGLVPAIPASIDYFESRYNSDQVAWLMVEAPDAEGAWQLAQSHDQDTTWPLYQVCFPAAVVNQWERKLMAPSDVMSFRPGLSETGKEWISEAVGNGWLPNELKLLN